MNRSIVWTTRAWLMGTAAVLSAHAGQARANSVIQIPPEVLPRALEDFGAQSGLSVIADSRLTANKQSPGVNGATSPDTALAALLRGTGLTYKHSDDTVMILAENQTPTPPRSQSSIETVTVTAQKKKEDIQQVPIAVSAFTQKQLTERQVATGGDLIRETPNMNFGKTNFSGYSIELRGIGTQAISVTTDPAVAVAFNGTPFLRNHFFEQEFFDLDNVEVLRGPQGTLYGRNATAGVVDLASAKPTDEFEANASVDLGNYNNRRLEGMVNLPIVSDKLELRLAGEWTKRDGYTEDTTLNTSVDGRDLWSGRATLAFTPTADLQTYLVWEHYSEDDNRLRSGKQLCKTSNAPTSVDGQPVPPGNLDVRQGSGLGTLSADFLSTGCEATSLYSSSAFQVPNGFSLPYVIALGLTDALNPTVNPYAETTQSPNLRSIQSQLMPNYRAKNDTIEFNATYAINPNLSLFSQTGFNQDFLWSTEDYNRFDTTPGIFNLPGPNAPLFAPDPGAGTNGIPANAAEICDPQLGCSDRLVAEDLNNEHSWQLSQEFRLASDFGGPLNFSVGGSYLHYETEENYYVFINALTGYSALDGNQLATGSTADNSDCLQPHTSLGGYQNPNPRLGGGEPTQTCIFIDTNPIGSLNNKGHNYFLSQNPYVLNSYAGFGELYYNITNALKFTGGLRYTIDQKHFTDIPSEVIAQQSGYPVTGVVDQEWDRLTGRAVLNWTPALDFTDQSMFYTSYAHGYKAGGANPPGAIFPQFGAGAVPFVDHPLTFKPEYIEAFELGTKNTLMDSSLTLNGDIFYYNYTGYQISEIVDRTAINNNYNAHVEGAELESTYEPLPGLRFNFAGGWEDTAAAGGDSGIDLMDRTAGNPNWMVVKPFPTQASNCILPTYVVATLLQEQAAGAGAAGFACETAYIDHLDPATGAPYVPNPIGNTVGPPGFTNINTAPIPGGYPGYNPATPIANNGEGIAKNLAGHKLPNSPPFTLSFGSQYTIPVSTDWTATLRGDFYWQGNSFARIFNDRPYDQLHGYTNLNLALILTSADGWQVMGYVKNVFNTTAITGDFLNSDDSGLTTNVFLTDPRLIGIRVTKDFSAGEGNGGYGVPDFLSGLFADTDKGRPPLWIEIGGDAERITGQGQNFPVPFLNAYPASPVLQHTSPLQAQNPPPFAFDEEAEVTFEPTDSDWVFSAAVRFGRSGNTREVDHQTNQASYEKYRSGAPAPDTVLEGVDRFADTRVHHLERHLMLDFLAGKEVGFGIFGEKTDSVLSAGVRFAQFSSDANLDLRARPDLDFHYFPSAAATTHFKLPSFHTYHVSGQASRKFHGVGPTVSWKASTPFVGDLESGELAFDWGANGALLFGRQRSKTGYHASANYANFARVLGASYVPQYSKSGGHLANHVVVVPNIGAFAGVSYRFNNAKVSFGYKADMFINAIDGGIDKRESQTLGFFGPYAKISIGLGG